MGFPWLWLVLEISPLNKKKIAVWTGQPPHRRMIGGLWTPCFREIHLIGRPNQYVWIICFVIHLRENAQNMKIPISPEEKHIIHLVVDCYFMGKRVSLLFIICIYEIVLLFKILTNFFLPLLIPFLFSIFLLTSHFKLKIYFQWKIW